MKSIFFAVLAVVSSNAFAASDPLTRTALRVPGPQGEVVLERTVSDLRAIFEKFVPGLDSSSTITKPLSVTGPADRPVVKVSIRKCVVLVCETVDLDAEATIREVSGPCAKNYLLQADLSRSSASLADIYDRLDVAGCYKPSDDGSGTLSLDASAHQAPRYSQGFVQGEIVKMLELQVGPITKAIQDTMKAKSAEL